MRVRASTALLRSEDAKDHLAADRDAVYFDRPVDAQRLASISDVHLWSPHGSPIERLPEMIADMSGLKSLSIGPGHILPTVITEAKQGDFPVGLESLSIHTGDKTLKWPGIVMPHVTTLYSDGPFRFANEHFPHLRNLSIIPNKSFSNIRQVLELPLEELNLLKTPIGEEVFNIVAPAGLRRLGLLNGRTLKSLTGISTLPHLESLRLKVLSSLGDVSELASLQELEILNVQYCSKITGIEAINALPKLRRLTMVGCGNVGLDSIELAMRRLEWVNTGATT